MKPSRHPEVVHDVIDGRAVLVDPAGTEIITLNEAGSQIWETLDGSADAQALAAAHPEFTLEDVQAFLEELAAAGLIIDGAAG